MRLWQLIVIFICSLAMAHSTWATDKIILKGSGVGGWTFSTDGTTFHDAGFFGGALRKEMNNSEDAVKRMNSYKANRWGASLTGLSAVALFSWAAIKYFNSSSPPDNIYDRSERHEINYTMIVAGSISAFICAVCQIGADHQLKEAVKSFNGSGTTRNGLILSPQVAASDSLLRIAVVVSF